MNRDQMIKEARQIEAMKKGYMGLEGKFATIAKRLGHSLISQGNLHVDRTYLEDPYYEEDPNELPTMDDDEQSHEIGIHFDGLSRGINLSISILFHLRNITVRYEGQIVYKEIAGELEGYAPMDVWEFKVEELYDFSKKLERKQRPQEQKRIAAEVDKKRKEILESLRLKWGL
jgi:hypothetical protein